MEAAEADDRWPGTLAAAVLVCTSPRATIRAIVASAPRRHVVPLLLLAGFAGVLGPDRAQPFGVAGAVLLPFAAVPVVWGLGCAMAWVGRRLGGRADAVAVRAVLAWSGVPAILALGVRLVLVAALGAEAVADGFVARWNEVFAGLVGIWVWGLNLVLLAEVNGFSLVRAFATSLLGSLAFALPIVLVVTAALLLAAFGVEVRLVN